MSTVTREQIRAVKRWLAPLDHWAGNCHGASLEVVKSDILPASRVARGGCDGVFSQHSWVVVGMDCYDEDATIIDPTLWYYRNDVKDVWVGTLADGLHAPHGAGSIWQWGRPPSANGTAVELTPREPLSSQAQKFLDLLGPLDARGWNELAHAPVQGWPAREILPAIEDTFPGAVPIDILGMLTDRNPGGLYRG